MVLNWYKVIWINDDEIKTQQRNTAERLAYHQEHSLAVMQKIRDWGEQQLANEQVEANSGLGKAIRYFLNHYEGLSRFCTVEGATLMGDPLCRFIMPHISSANLHVFGT